MATAHCFSSVGNLWVWVPCERTVLSSDSLFHRVHILCQLSQDHSQAWKKKKKASTCLSPSLIFHPDVAFHEGN